jgi:hypothetical protein
MKIAHFRMYSCAAFLLLSAQVSALESPSETAFTAQVTVLATEFTLGPGGPSSPIILGSYVNPKRGWLPLFSDLPVKPGLVDVIDLTAGDGLMLRATVSAGRMYQTDGDHAFVFRNGDVVADFLKMNRVQTPYGDQRSLDVALADHIDAKSGRITLADNQLLITFELGTDDPANPAYDFQDLVLLAEFTDLTALAMVPRRTPADHDRQSTP